MPYHYPMMLDVTDRLAVIVGGGTVAVRKAAGLIAAGARRIRVVAPSFHADLAAQVERVREAYHAGHLADAGLVFAATDAPVVNEAVVRDARALGVLVCRADVDDETPGDFATPAIFWSGPVAVTVSAAGAPALAAAIRDELAQRLDPRWARMAQAMLVIRPAIRNAQDLAPARRRALFRELAAPDALAALETAGMPGLWRWILGRYPEVAASSPPAGV